MMTSTAAEQAELIDPPTMDTEHSGQPSRPQTDFVIHLTDYSPFEDGNNGVNKNFTNFHYDTVKALFGDKVTESNYIHLFYKEVQDMLWSSPAENILLLDNSDPQDADDKDDSGLDYLQQHGVPRKNKLRIFNILGNRHWVGKYTGVLRFKIPGNRETDTPEKSLTIHIRSRFDQNDQAPFLLYMFAKTLNPNGKIFHDMQVPASADSVWELLLATAFVRQLHNAMKKGMLRQYRDYARNDSRLKGHVDVARHIRENTPFIGNVAYTAREYVVDNPVNILILRTMAHLEKKHGTFMRRVLSDYPVVKQGLTLLKSEIPHWQAVSDAVILRNTTRKVANSVYRDYETVRKTAFAIWNQLGVNAFMSSAVSGTPDAPYSVSGFLINMPDLWEKFLHATVFQEYLPGEYRQTGYPIIGSGSGDAKGRIAKPDFLLQKERIVLDAKYKAGWGRTLDGDWGGVRDDSYQILAYALIFNCTYCGVIFPVSMQAISGLSQQGSGKKRGRRSTKALTADITGKLKQHFEAVEVQQTWCKDRYFVRIPYVIPEITEQILAQDGGINAEFEKSALWIRTRIKELAEGPPSQETTTSADGSGDD